MALGIASLTDAELLALQLRTGTAGLPVLRFAQELLDRFGGFSGLLQADMRSFEGIKGLGPARRAELSAMAEIQRRALAQQVREQPVLSASAAVRAYLQLHLGKQSHEEFAVLFTDAQHRVITLKTLFRGSLTSTSVYPREVVKEALASAAAYAIVAHNHPSGACEPSSSDKFLTRTLRDALALVDVTLLDHIVVGQGQTYSFAEEGMM